MQQVKFNYSTKDIPIPSHPAYVKRMIEKADSLISRMRWKAFFSLKKKPETETDQKERYGFKTSKPPPYIPELRPFEDGLYDLIGKIKTKTTKCSFQNKLREDMRNVKNSNDIYVPADKTRNYYKVDEEQYGNLLTTAVTKGYKKAPKNSYDNTNLEAKDTAENLDLADRIDTMAEKHAFVTLKDHKPNFENNPSCRLINPAKSEIGKISKVILDKINTAVRKSSQVNQWRSTTETIDWFKKINDKANCNFMVFDIVEFYPSISANLLTDALNFARQYVHISQSDEEIILHSRKSFLFTNDKTWIKRKTTGANPFDVPMGCFDGAEICELIGLYILNGISDLVSDVGLYRDDGLAIIRNCSPSDKERLKKRLCAKFSSVFGLKITVDTNLQIVNFLDVTFNLPQATFKPFRKPNDTPVYINTKSNHPPNIFKELPNAINKRLSSLSDSTESFNEAVPTYQKALSDSGYTHNFEFESSTQRPSNKQRKRKIIWFNPPFSKNISTNIGKEFFKLIDHHFPIGSPYTIQG